MLMSSSNALGRFFGESLLDDFFEMPSFARLGNFGGATKAVMHTDVKELEDGYEITMNLPGFKKEEVKGEIKDGYLTISAVSNTEKDEKDEEGRYIRRERYTGSCSRSFYVGSQLTQEDIKAKFEDGVLRVSVPKAEAKPAVESRHYIAIEG